MRWWMTRGYPFVNVDCEKVDCDGWITAGEVILEHGTNGGDVGC